MIIGKKGFRSTVLLMGAVTLTVAGGLFLSAPTNAASDKITMKIATSAAGHDPRNLAADHFAKTINASSECNVHALVFPNSQLGGSNSQLQQVQHGGLEAAVLPFAFAGGIQPLFQIMSVANLLPQNPKNLLELERSDIMHQLLKTSRSKGMVGLGVWPTGYKEWTTTKPIRNLKDFHGLVSRVMPSKVLADGQSRLGIQNVSMDFGDLYTALQSGTVEATHNPIALIYSMKFYEPAKYMTITNDGVLAQVLFVSNQFWNKLSPACHQEMWTATRAASDVSFHETYRQIPAALKAFKEAGMTIIHFTPAERNAMVKVTYGNRAYFVKQTGKQGAYFLKGFEDEIKKIETAHPDRPAFDVTNWKLWAH